jgi:hypothetical protein
MITCQKALAHEYPENIKVDASAPVGYHTNEDLKNQTPYALLEAVQERR